MEMRRVIRGKRYDTDKATLVAETTSGGAPNDFRYWQESLYRSPRGNWFVVGCGHAMTQWATHTVDGSGWGEGLRPIEPRAALQWLEDAGETEQIDKYFQVEDA